MRWVIRIILFTILFFFGTDGDMKYTVKHTIKAKVQKKQNTDRNKNVQLINNHV